MCFSAAASFGASAVLGGAGAISLSKTTKQEDLFLASVPLLFSVQQLLEGFVWLFPSNGTTTLIFAYAFLFFAFLLWPLYIPLVAWSSERDTKRKCLLHYLVGAGILGSTLLLVTLITQPLSVVIVGNSIRYDIDTPFGPEGIILYIIVTVGSLLLSTDRFLKLFGLATFFSAGLAWFVYRQTFSSVWCFFAAILSFAIIVHLHRKKLRK